MPNSAALYGRRRSDGSAASAHGHGRERGSFRGPSPGVRRPMNPEIAEKVALVLASAAVGWLASMLTTIVNERRASRKERRKVATRLWLALENLLKESAILPALRDAGALTVAGVLGVDESWRRLIPPDPPSLPDDFDDVLAKVAEWEASTGRARITDRLQLLRAELKILHALHAGLSAQARHGEDAISKQAAEYYPHALEHFGESLQQALRLVDPLRLTAPRRAWKKLRRMTRLRGRFKRKGPPSLPPERPDAAD